MVQSWGRRTRGRHRFTLRRSLGVARGQMITFVLLNLSTLYLAAAASSLRSRLDSDSLSLRRRT